MKRILSLIAFSIVLLLTACGGDKESLETGIDAFEKGNYATAYDFFKHEMNENPNKTVNSWLEKTKSEYAKVLTTEINDAYKNSDVKKAYELVQIALEINPDDKGIIQAAEKVEKDYLTQLDYDKYTTFLNESKLKITNITDTWNSNLTKLRMNQISLNKFLAIALELQPELNSLVEATEKVGYTLEEPAIVDVNNKLYQYAFALKTEINRVIVSKELSPEEIYSYSMSFQQNYRKNTFDSIKSDLDYYVNEKDHENERVRNIKNTIDF